MAWMVMANYMDDNTGVDVCKPRFPVSSSEADAKALCERLNRLAREQWMQANLQTVRRAQPPDVHTAWREAAHTVLLTLDGNATYDVRYSVEEVGAPFAEPAAPDPANPMEAFFYDLRDGDFALPPPPEPEPEP